jgi:hypothetical protein
MMKKVLCRVISSMPLNESGGTLWSEDSPRRRFETISFPATYTNRLNTIPLSINETPAGEIFDCYA